MHTICSYISWLRGRQSREKNEYKVSVAHASYVEGGLARLPCCERRLEGLQSFQEPLASA